MAICLKAKETDTEEENIYSLVFMRFVYFETVSLAACKVFLFINTDLEELSAAHTKCDESNNIFFIKKQINP